jgi:hypothetical protein
MKTLITIMLVLFSFFSFSQEIKVEIVPELKDCKIENIPEGTFSRITWEYKDSTWKFIDYFPKEGKLLIMFKIVKGGETFVGFLPFYYNGKDTIFTINLEKTKNKNYEKSINNYSFDDFSK